MILQGPGANRLVFIGLDVGGNAGAQAQLERLAQLSGGRFVLASDPTALPQLLLAATASPSPAGVQSPGTLIAAPPAGPRMVLPALLGVNLLLVLGILLLRLKR